MAGCGFMLISQIKTHLQSYPCPININFMWNFGFLAGIVFFIQILSGLLLASLFVVDSAMSYNAVQYITKEINGGWQFRYLHAVVASGVFICLYVHFIRGLVFSSFRYLNLTWISGLIILLITVVIAFLGYVLPWGQMSFWAATVISNLLTSIPMLVPWLCGGYYVTGMTLRRFFVLHFILPFIALGLVLVHILYLHQKGSNNPIGCESPNKVSFYPAALWSDLKGFNLLILAIFSQLYLGILTLSHPDNSIPVDRFVTPLQIVPEWYFLPFYALLKCVPHKTSGLLLMLALLQSLYLITEQRNLTTKLINPTKGLGNMWLLFVLYSLVWIGAQLPQGDYLSYGRIYIVIYFMLILLITGVS